MILPRSVLQLAVEDYLNHLSAERGVATNTLAAYGGDLSRYERFCKSRGRQSLRQVNGNDVEDFLSSLRQGESPLSDASIARSMAAVRGLHRFAAREGLVADDVAASVKPPTPGLRLPDAISAEAMQRLLEAPGDDPQGLRDRALLELMYGSGCRVSEALNCDVDDLYLDDRAVRLFGKGRKERIVPIGSHCVTALDAYLVRSRPVLAEKQGSHAVFLNNRGGRLSRQSAWTAIKRCVAKAGLPSDIHPHTLRHSCATHLLEGGADIRVVQEFLGHASVTTTQIYTKVTIEHLREVYATSHPRAR